MNEEKNKIIYLWNYIQWGGAQIYFFGLMKEAKKKYSVEAVFPENSQPQIFNYLENLDIPYQVLSASKDIYSAAGIKEKIGVHLRKHKDENKLIRELEEKFDLSETIIHLDLSFWQSFLTLFRLSSKTKVFLTVHTALPNLPGWRGLNWRLKGKILSRLDNFYLNASNENAKESLRPFLTEKKFNDIKIAYSGIDPDEINQILAKDIDRKEICRKYKLPAGRFLIFTVGQFIERKGCWEVLESLQKLKSVSSDFFFAWLGTSPLDEETKRKIEQYDLTDHFRFFSGEEIGKKREDLLTFLSIADLFVLASRQEGLPISLVEAMALGLPCIATEINAIPEAIENKKTGILIAPKNSEQLTEAIVYLRQNADLAKQMAAEAQKKAFEMFSEKRAAEVTLKRYADVIAGKSNA